jgi:hypothetical protein
VITRRRKIIFIQLTIFLIASFLLYLTYSDKNKNVKKEVKIETESKVDTNSFTDIEYSGFDLNGNRYLLKAVKAEFESETPELINMKIVVANFYLKDDTILTVISEEGLYNNITLDMEFRQNVKATYLTNTLLSDQLTYSNSDGKLLATGNVRGESIEKGEFSADNVEYDLTSKILNFAMFGNKQVNVKLKN